MHWNPLSRPPSVPSILIGMAVLVCSSPSLAEDLPSALTLDQITNSSNWRTGSSRVRWHEEGASTLEQEDSVTLEDARDLVRYETESRKRSLVVQAEDLIPEGTEIPLKIDGISFSEDGNRLLIFTNSKRVWRRNTRGDYWVFDRSKETLTQLGGEAAPSTLLFAKFSPDAESVAYVRENNLYVERLTDHTIRQLTHDGSEFIVNGTSDWASEEELDIRDGYRWSPDGQQIAFWRFDTSQVGVFSLINQTDTLYPKIHSYPYPKAGTTNSEVSIGIVSTQGGPITWMSESDDPRNHYIAKLEWAANSDEIMVQHLNRHQNTLEVRLGNITTGKYRTLLTERDDAWIDVVGDWRWLDDGSRLLWVSERDGWRHVYSVSRDGQNTTLLTPGDFDVITIEGFDEEASILYFIASPDDPASRYLYRASLNGGVPAQRVTPIESTGYHRYNLSPNGKWAIHTASQFDDPGIAELIQLPSHTHHRELHDNQAIRSRLSALERGNYRFFRLAIPADTEGKETVELDGFEMRPPDFNPNRKYPVVFFVYGEPWNQTVLNRWSGSTYLWHLFLTQNGYLVISLDNRGTPAPRGRAWRKIIYQRLGELSSFDQAQGAKKISQWDYVDPGRLGIWGHSGGGSMTLNMLFREPGLYRAGVSVAPVPDQRYYDSIYQERYMGLPTEDPEVYELNSPISFAENLEDNLLIIHGTGDDNVHYQGTEALINKLIAHGKQFSIMPYPNRTHGVRNGEGTYSHRLNLMTNFLFRHLPSEIDPGAD